MAEFNFIGGTYQAPSLTADAQTCYNLYLERDESGAGKSKATLLGTPGLTLIATLPTSPVRAIWAGGSEANDSSRIFVVSGSKLYEIDAAGSIVGGTNRGDVGNDNYPAQIFVNTAESVSGVPQNQLMIVSAGKAYLDQGGAANGANAQQITFSASTYAGTVSATGGSAAITWVSGDEFDQFLVGQTIVLNFVNYTVGVVIDSFHLTLTTSYAVSGFTPSLPYSASVTGANVTARTGAFLDGYFFVNQPYTNLFFFSSINDGTQWSTLDTGAKQASADALVGMLVDHENLWLFGDNTTEVWYDAGTSPPAIPFSRVSGGVLPIGTVSPWNMCSLSNGPAWIGADSRGTVAAWYAQGLTPQRISTHALEQIWADYNALNDVTAYVYQQGGHLFWVVNFPSGGATWVYDATENMWHQRGSLISGSQGPCVARFHCYAYGSHYCGDFQSGKIYTMDHRVYTEAGAAITRQRAAPYISHENQWTFFSRFRLDAENSGALNPLLDWSNDGAVTFIDQAATTSNVAGVLAQYDWRRLGKSRARVFRVTTTAAVKVAFVNAYVETIGGST